MERVDLPKRRIKVRHVKKDEGVFETGLDVIEHEYDLEEDAAGNLLQIRQFHSDGVLTNS